MAEVVFPSADWMIAAKDAVNASEEYKKVAKDWEGNFRCVIDVDDIAVKDFSDPKVVEGFATMIFSADEETRNKYAGTKLVDLLAKVTGIDDPLSLKSFEEARKKIDFEDAAKKMSQLKPEDYKGAESFLLAGFYHGGMTDLKVIGPEDEMGSRFVLSGPFGNWKKMVYGEQDATKLVMSGALKLKGDMNYLMKNIRSVVQFTKDFAKPLSGK
jgi:putative sterol carrier protein